MTGFINKVHILWDLTVDRAKASPSLIFRSILVGLTSESQFIINMIFPALLLNLVMQSGNFDRVLIVVLLVSALLMFIGFVDDVHRKSYRNHFIRAMHYWALTLRNKVHKVDLITVESNEGKKKFWRADEGLFNAVDVIEVIFATLLSRIITLVVTLYIFSHIHFLVAILIWTTAVLGYMLDSKRAEKMVQYEQKIAENNHILKYMDKTMFELSIVREIRFSDGKDFLSSHYTKILATVRKIQDKQRLTNFNYQVARAIVSLIRTTIIYGLGVWRFSLGELPLSDFLLFAGAAQLMSDSTVQIFEAFVSLSKMIPHYETLSTYMSLPNYADKSGSLPMPDSIEEIVFDDVTFYYPNQQKPALENVSFVLKGTDTVALVGENGAGKSTVIKLLLRLYDVSSGRIMLNGIDIREYDYNEYYNFFTAAFQDFNIFSFTIGENLTFGENNKSVYEHLSNIGLKKKIDSLPKGLNTEYSTMFVEDGVLFSGGEAQKLAIARALCREKSQALIMDEPTAALDAIAEYNLNNLIYGLSKNRFTLFVSHRFSTTRFCNMILVFDKGKLVEKGSHTKLLEDKKLYAQMYDMQIAFFQKGDG